MRVLRLCGILAAITLLAATGAPVAASTAKKSSPQYASPPAIAAQIANTTFDAKMNLSTAVTQTTKTAKAQFKSGDVLAAEGNTAKTARFEGSPSEATASTMIATMNTANYAIYDPANTMNAGIGDHTATAPAKEKYANANLSAATMTFTTTRSSA